MKKTISLALCLVMLLSLFTFVSSAAGECYPQYTGKSTSIVDALKSLKVESSYAYRVKIAAANNIKDYTGTAAQNIQMLDLLKAGKLVKGPAVEATAPAPAVTAQPGCYEPYTGNSGSIVVALKSLKVESSYAYRAKIAAANNIKNYTGTAAQNIQMLELLKAGKLVKGPAVEAAAPTVTAQAGCYEPYTGKSPSIVDALKSLKVESSYAYRAKIAAANNIKDYTGTAAQNIQMLELLKAGKLVKGPAVEAAAPAPAVTAQPGCYEPYTGNSGSIVDALKSLKVESSYAYRAKIAAANNIKDYTGTAAQNIQMLELLKAGKLVKAVETVSGGAGG